MTARQGALKALDLGVIPRSEFKHSASADPVILPPECFALAHRRSHPRVLVLSALLWLRFLSCYHLQHFESCGNNCMPVEIYNAASHRAVESLAAKLRRRSVICSPQ